MKLLNRKFSSLFIFILIAGCYSPKEINDKTGLYESSRNNKAFLINGKDYSVTTKIYNNDTLIAKRITYNIYYCTHTEKESEKIIYYNESRKKTKEIEYFFLGENKKTIMKSEIIYENKKSNSLTIEVIENSAENLYEIKNLLLYQ